MIVQWDKFMLKNATLCLHILFWHFLFVFHQSNCIFIIFISFFDTVSNFRNRILTNQKPELVTRNCHWKCMNQNIKEEMVMEATMMPFNKIVIQMVKKIKMERLIFHV